ncbi:MAG TPA: hypothetical protein VGC84_04370 [Ilumatobacteraceae bacterium]
MSSRFGITGGFSAAVAATKAAEVAGRGAPPSARAELTASASEFARLAIARAQLLSPSMLGKTFVYSSAQAQYVASARSGAPSNGVRFVLYAVDPITQQPATSSEVGYADVIDLNPTSPLAVALRLVVVGGSTTYLDYTVSASATGSSSADFSILGFVSDGATHVDVNVTASVVITGNSSTVNVAWTYTVPSRDLTVSGSATSLSSLDAATGQLDLTIHSASTVIHYTFSGTGSTLNVTVTVNGTTFATITGTFSDPVIRGIDGHVLSNQEIAALGELLKLADQALSLLGDLLSPVAG